MGTTGNVFGEQVQKALDAVDRNRFIVTCVVGYGLCRGISGAPLHLIDHGSASFWADAGKLVGIALMMGACLLPAVERRVRGRWGAYLVPTACGLVGALLAVACQLIPGAPAPLACAALLAIGLGPAAMMLQWLELIGYLSLRSIALVIAGAELLNALLSLLSGPGGALSGWRLGCLVACSGALLLYSRRGLELSPALARPPLATQEAEPFSIRRFISWKLMAWVLFYCFAYGVVTAHLGHSLTSVGNDVGALLPCVATLVLAFALPERFDMRALRRIALVFMVAGLVLAALMPGSGLAVQACVGAGAASCRLFAYSLACMRARHGRVSAIPACGAVKALIIVATSGGLAVGASALPLSQTGMLALLAVAACAVSAGISPFDLGAERVIDEARESGRAVSQDARLTGVAREIGLSERETTVFRLMARGMNAGEISEELFITKSAVRAHQSRIYAKLGVHGHQEFAQTVAQRVG